MSRTCLFLERHILIAAFFMFLRQKTYPKIWAEPVIQMPDTLLVIDENYRKLDFE